MSMRKTVSDWDIAIREGRGASIVEDIKALKISDIPEMWRPEMAALCRRLGLYKKGFQFIKTEYFSKRSNEAPENMMVEYAALLTEVGAVKISQKILDKYPHPIERKTYFYRALLRMKTWNYQEAVADLKAFRNLSEDSYWQSIAEINLVGTLIFLREFDEAGQLISFLEAKENELPNMAKGILSELKGQFLFFTEN